MNSPQLDAFATKRLNAALQALRDKLIGTPPLWYTLRQVSDLGGCSEAAASARLRQLRSLGYQVDAKPDPLGKGGWIYRVWPR